VTGAVPGQPDDAAQASAQPPSLAAMLAVGAFALLSLVGGWLIVLGGGFHHAPGRRASTVFVDGAPALVMAMLQFLAAALALTWLLRPRLGRWPAALLAAALALALPLLLLTSRPMERRHRPCHRPRLRRRPPRWPPAPPPTSPPVACRCG
jgi:hypothetical protein